MFQRIASLFTLCVCVLLLVAGCQAGGQAVIPVTGGEAAPSRVTLARDNVLEYVVLSSRLAGVPSSAEWRLEKAGGEDGEYSFISGDWHMVVTSANAGVNQQVMIMNRATNDFWCGYVKPDGKVVDTCLML